MRPLMQRFWKDDGGAVLTAEWLFLTTLIVIGLVAGLKAVQHSVNTELEGVSGATSALCQSYSFTGMSACCGNDGVGYGLGGYGLGGYGTNDLLGLDPSGYMRFNLDTGRFYSSASYAGGGYGGGFGGCFAATCGSAFNDAPGGLVVKNNVPTQNVPVQEVPAVICPD